jgi:hypothetical protein
VNLIICGHTQLEEGAFIANFDRWLGSCRSAALALLRHNFDTPSGHAEVAAGRLARITYQ